MQLRAAASLDGLVSALNATGREVAGSDGVAVVLRSGGFCHYVAENAIMPLWRGSRFRLEECISGWAMLNDRTAIVPDVWNDLRVPISIYRTSSVRSLVMTPIGVPTPVAALGAYWCAWVEPDEGTVLRLQALADMATEAFTRLQPSLHAA